MGMGEGNEGTEGSSKRETGGETERGDGGEGRIEDWARFDTGTGRSYPSGVGLFSLVPCITHFSLQLWLLGSDTNHIALLSSHAVPSSHSQGSPVVSQLEPVRRTPTDVAGFGIALGVVPAPF